MYYSIISVLIYPHSCTVDSGTRHNATHVHVIVQAQPKLLHVYISQRYTDHMSPI